jgi:hypothetical protein
MKKVTSCHGINEVEKYVVLPTVYHRSKLNEMKLFAYNIKTTYYSRVLPLKMALKIHL